MRKVAALAVLLCLLVPGAPAFASQPAVALAATYTATPPASMGAASDAIVSVAVTNSGTATWTAAGPQPVDLAYHWHDAAGNTVVWDGLRTPLAADVAPGQSVTLQARVVAPSGSGQYTLTFDLVREGVAWFQQL